MINAEQFMFQGKKILSFDSFFNNVLDYVECFRTEDGEEWVSITHRMDWTSEMTNLAKERGLI